MHFELAQLNGQPRYLYILHSLDDLLLPVRIFVLLFRELCFSMGYALNRRCGAYRIGYFVSHVYKFQEKKNKLKNVFTYKKRGLL